MILPLPIVSLLLVLFSVSLLSCWVSRGSTCTSFLLCLEKFDLETRFACYLLRILFSCHTLQHLELFLSWASSSTLQGIPAADFFYFFFSLRGPRANNPDSIHPSHIFWNKINYVLTAELIFVALYPSDFPIKTKNIPISLKSKTTRTKVQQLKFQ